LEEVPILWEAVQYGLGGLFMWCLHENIPHCEDVNVDASSLNLLEGMVLRGSICMVVGHGTRKSDVGILIWSEQASAINVI
jgi:hypothetical protein